MPPKRPSEGDAPPDRPTKQTKEGKGENKLAWSAEDDRKFLLAFMALDDQPPAFPEHKKAKLAELMGRSPTSIKSRWFITLRPAMKQISEGLGEAQPQKE
ncbi:Homeodomain-like [Ceraceosorus bombacis]|uniref:Homeodomain-like n=1 Tax=Ceraceosorus bombacis TaxID=401625 RepID=A0A0P1BFX3_9BASI|nr:Homeodomain-like [Ceraceosorus bombacis]